jgi:hypothetical protein
VFRQRNGAKYSESENKYDNLTVKLLLIFNSEYLVIHSYVYNNIQLMTFNEVDTRIY